MQYPRLSSRAVLIIGVAILALGLNRVLATSVLFEPLDGTAYFGFTFRNWESADPAVGDTRPFVERYQDVIVHELGGRAPSLFAVPTLWQKADGTFVPFTTVMQNQINLYRNFSGGRSIPLISWNAQTGWDTTSASYSGITTQTVLGGSLDTYIRQYARDVKAYGKPIFIRLLCGEANGSWWRSCSPNANPSLTKADFIGAWQHVVTLFREEGADNVAWVWNMTTFPPPPANWGIDTDIASYYPGDAYVDWVGADHYDYGDPLNAGTNPMNIAQYLDPHDTFAMTHAKPFFLAEWGIKHSGSKLTPLQHAEWLNGMFDYIETHPRIKAVLYFNYNSNNAASEDAAHMSNHIWLYDGAVNFHPNVNNADHRLLAETGADLRGTFAARIQNVRYISDIAVNGARFVSQNVPLTMTGGFQYAVSVTMENTGTGTVWTQTSGYQLGSLNPEDTLVWGLKRVALDASDAIGPDQQKTFAFTVTAPLISGSYNFQWGMLQENVGRFGEATANAVVTVLEPDVTPPSVTLASPANGATVTGSVLVTAQATDAGGVTKVEFYLDGARIATDTAAPYATTWDTRAYRHATSHTLVAKAYDTAGNIGTSASVTVTVRDIVSPIVSITAPANGSTVQRNATTTITATASDISGITKVEFFVNNTLKCTDTAAPYSCAWAVPAQKGTTYTLKAVASDTVPLTASSTVQVTSSR